MNEDNDSRVFYLNHLGTCHCCHQFSTVFGDTPCLRLLPHHEPSDILKKEKRDVPLATKFYEVGSLESAFGEENTIVANHTNRGAIQAAKATNQCITIPRICVIVKL